MAKKVITLIKLQIPGGQANPAPPVGPALGQHGVNIMCPIETPEGPNIGLIGALASYATVSEFGFIQTPYRVVEKAKVSDEIVYLDAAQEAQYTIAQASEAVDPKTGKFVNEQVLCRSAAGEAVIARADQVDYMRSTRTSTATRWLSPSRSPRRPRPRRAS